MKYLNDATRYAAELTEAANAGDWERYRNVNAQLAAETTSAVLDQAVQAEKGRQAAVRAVPGFDRFYGSDEYDRILSENRELGAAIKIAERDASVQSNLPGLYRLAHKVHKADRATIATSAPNPPEALRTELTPAAATEENIFKATQLSKQAYLTPTRRKALIAELEARGAADVEW